MLCFLEVTAKIVTSLLKQKNRITFAIMKNDIRKTFDTLLKNKYAIAVLVFVVWLAFFDPDDLFSRIELERSVASLTEQCERLSKEIDEDYRKMEELSSVETLEKFAREEYYMKAADEVVFIVK